MPLLLHALAQGQHHFFRAASRQAVDDHQNTHS